MKPLDPHFEERVRASVERQVLLRTLGARMTGIAPGEVEFQLPYKEDLTQQHGFLHGGVVASLMDSACGFAAFTLMPAEAAVLGVEYKVSFLAPARGDLLIAHGKVTKPGRTLTFASGEAWMQTGSERKRVATMLATIMTVEGRSISG